MHAIHNAVQTRFLNKDDFFLGARELEGNVSDAVLKAIDPMDRQLVTMLGNVDVSLIVHMLSKLGYEAEIV
tara:strand:- start:235 stop:447 length:213 start_codon:yes stop_codon:yes gene_type:complete